MSVICRQQVHLMSVKWLHMFQASESEGDFSIYVLEFDGFVI